MIEVTDLTKTYRMGEIEVHALQEVSLTILDGELVAIIRLPALPSSREASSRGWR